MAENDVPFPEEEQVAVNVDMVTKHFGEAITKQAIKAKVKRDLQPLLDGDIGHPLNTYVHAKVLQEYLGEVMKVAKELAMDEAASHGKGGGSVNGVKFEVAGVATRYSFDHDETWCELKDKEDEIAELRKKREDLMKKAMDFSGVVDDDGVVIPPAKYKSGGGDTIKVSIPTK